MVHSFRRGDVVLALCEGVSRELVVEQVSSDGRVAQCSWTTAGVKRYATVLLHRAHKVRSVHLRGKD